MRILYHHRTKSRDGQYVHIFEMQRAFARRGHELREVAPAQGGEAPKFGGEAKSLARIGAAVPRSVYQFLEWGYNAVSYLRLHRAVLEFRPDVIYERYALGNVAGVLVARRFQIPLLLEVNAPLAWERHRFGGLAFPKLAHRIEAATLRRADRVIAVTGVLKAMLVDSGADPARVDVMANGIDPARFAGARPPKEAQEALGIDADVVLGFTGFCRDWHGLDRVVRLLASGAPGLAKAHLLVVGDGPACPGLRELAAELGVGDRLTITGIVDRDALVPYLSAFDVALQPDVTSYASPLKLFEYLHFGMAIVAPDRSNIREVLTDGADAVLFDPDDKDAFGRAVVACVADADLRARIGAGARALVDARGYTWDENARRVEDLVRALSNGRA